VIVKSTLEPQAGRRGRRPALAWFAG